MLVFLFALLSISISLAASISIDQFGAVANENSFDVAVKNGKALYLAVLSANISDVDRTVLVPSGQVYTFVPFAQFYNLSDITIQLDGTISIYSDNHALWPNHTDSSDAMHVLEIIDSHQIQLTGQGTIQGNGYSWWWEVILKHHDHRPHLVYMSRCQHVLIQGWHLHNSPAYHILIDDMLDVLIENIEVHVDVWGQSSLLSKLGLMSNGKDLPFGIPTFPLNTDGIDVAGQRITVRNCTIQNFDDSVCAKPLNGAYRLSNCTQDLLFEDIKITLGVGASVGSVRPDEHVNCVRNVTFRNIEFQNPIKAIYIKPNPGDSGTGIIDSITYENIYAYRPLWWSIWVSTQQQVQPGGGSNTHCSFFYPLFNSTCPLQPRVPVTNLVLRNVTMVDALLSPGVLRCAEEGPCTNWRFENVHFKSLTNYPNGDGFLCEGIHNATWADSYPMCK
eukprot:TRINITY_DN1121_c0_g1_i1.p1 TRINITY_DN1121_c0_g1~~TRINITY_DN1121_c0_g1_i1.p1  ORF type:complete len:447 (+),score=79.76 TRINITY_DN1121_c0_g1_i1:43-1383(+)